MSAECTCRSLLRWLLLTGMLLTLAAGVLLLTLGADALIADGSRHALLLGRPLSPGVAVLLTAAGAALVLLALLGAAGALLSSRCLLITFSCLSALLLLLTLLTAVAALLITGPMSARFQQFLLASLQDYTTDESTRDAWDTLQSGFHCCGVTSGADWQKNSSISAAVPWSCCVVVNSTRLNCEEAPSAANSYWRTGCLSAVRGLLLGRGWVVGGATIAIAAFFFGATVAACCVARRRREPSGYEAVPQPATRWG